MKVMLTEEVRNKWQPVIEAEGVAPIKDTTIKNNVIRLLENQVNQIEEGADGAGTPSNPTNAASVKNWDPVLISLVRRTAPSLIANRMMGVQPMTGPTGLIFCLKAHSTNASGTVVNDLYGPGKVPDPTLGGGTKASQAQDSMATAEAEALGRELNSAVTGTVDTTTSNATQPIDSGAGVVGEVSPWAEMSFTIDQSSVTAESKALKARYTQELAQDLKAIHGLDAETELANLLSGEIIAEQNREVVDTVFSQAVTTLKTSEGAGNYSHAQSGGYDFYDYNGIGVLGADEGAYDLAVHSGGRWEQEHYKNLIGIINRVAHEVALGTRRGLGNFIVTDPITASALDMASKLNTGEDIFGGVNFGNDNIGVTFAGRLLNKYDVFVDPYRATNEILVGYRGANVYDAGYYYCPYVPLTMMKTIGESDFQPRIGFKTRYGMKHNPFVSGTAGQNWYYRKFSVASI